MLSLALKQRYINQIGYVIIVMGIIRESSNAFNVAKSHLFYTGGFYLLEIYILLFTLINKDRKNTYGRGVKMIHLYTTTSCISCRKAKAWLEEHQIDYIERNLSYEPITEDEIKNILSMTEKGTDEIISTRSKIPQKLNIEIDALSLQGLYDLIKSHPFILKRPIIIQDRKIMQIGYKEEEIRAFIPRKLRTFTMTEQEVISNH